MLANVSGLLCEHLWRSSNSPCALADGRCAVPSAEGSVLQLAHRGTGNVSGVTAQGQPYTLSHNRGIKRWPVVEILLMTIAIT